MSDTYKAQPLPVAYLRSLTHPDWIETCDKDAPGAFPVYAHPPGEVVVTRNQSGRIVAVTRQDDEGRILSVIAQDENAQAVQGWQPIETAPKDGTVILLAARNGVWVGKHLPVYTSGYVPDNPWSSMMLNHDHMAERYTRPTHWMPLPVAPLSDTARIGCEHGTIGGECPWCKEE